MSGISTEPADPVATPRMSEAEATRQQRFEGLYCAHHPLVMGYIMRRAASDEDAADAIAETFLVAWRRLDDAPEGDAGRLWLYGITRRTLANQRRGERRRNSLASRIADEPRPQAPARPVRHDRGGRREFDWRANPMTATRDQDQIATLSRISDSDAANRLRPDFHAEFLEEILSSDPTMPEYDASRSRPVSASRWRNRRPLLLAGNFAAVIVMLVLVLPGLFSSSTSVSPQSADAAILQRVQLAVTRHPGTVLVMKMRMYISGGESTQASRAAFDGTLELTELTPQSGGTMTSLTTGSQLLKPGAQLVQSGKSTEIYDPYRNVIYRTSADMLGSSAFVNPEKWIATQLREHRFHVVGDLTLDGQPAVEISSKNGQLRMYVNRTSYRPLRAVEEFGAQGTETIDYTEFELLPSTTENALLVNLAHLHPGARTVISDAAYSAAAERLGQGLAGALGSTGSGGSSSSGSSTSMAAQAQTTR